MIRRKIVLPSILLAVALLALNASAGALLYERTVSVNRSVNIFDVENFDVDLVFGDHEFVPTNGVTLFDDLVISPADVGTIYEATTDSDANFPVVATRVTDAANEFITVALTEDQTNGLTEQRISFENKFFDQAIPDNPPDLAGNVVDMVTMQVESFTLVEQGAIVEGQPVDLVLTVSFFSEIPEPQTMALLAIGVAASFALFKTRKT